MSKNSGLEHSPSAIVNFYCKQPTPSYPEMVMVVKSTVDNAHLLGYTSAFLEVYNSLLQTQGGSKLSGDLGRLETLAKKTLANIKTVTRYSFCRIEELNTDGSARTLLCEMFTAFIEAIKEFCPLNHVQEPLWSERKNLAQTDAPALIALRAAQANIDKMKAIKPKNPQHQAYKVGKIICVSGSNGAPPGAELIHDDGTTTLIPANTTTTSTTTTAAAAVGGKNNVNSDRSRSRSRDEDSAGQRGNRARVRPTITIPIKHTEAPPLYLPDSHMVPATTIRPGNAGRGSQQTTPTSASSLRGRLGSTSVSEAPQVPTGNKKKNKKKTIKI